MEVFIDHSSNEDEDTRKFIQSQSNDDNNAINPITDQNNDVDDKKETGDDYESGVYGSATNRSHEEVLVGALITENTTDDIEYSTSEDEDEQIVVYLTRTQTPRRSNTMKFIERGQRSYVRPQQLNDAKSDAEDHSKSKLNEEIKALRFTHHRTAFDVDINTLDAQPWRKKNANISDYFNYGFDEDSWNVYCEKQLRIRSSKGLGPYNPIVASLHQQQHQPQHQQQQSAVHNVKSPIVKATDAILPIQSTTVVSESNISDIASKGLNTAEAGDSSSTPQPPPGPRPTHAVPLSRYPSKHHPYLPPSNHNHLNGSGNVPPPPYAGPTGFSGDYVAGFMDSGEGIPPRYPSSYPSYHKGFSQYNNQYNNQFPDQSSQFGQFSNSFPAYPRTRHYPPTSTSGDIAQQSNSIPPPLMSNLPIPPPYDISASSQTPAQPLNDGIRSDSGDKKRAARSSHDASPETETETLSRSARSSAKDSDDTNSRKPRGERTRDRDEEPEERKASDGGENRGDATRKDKERYRDIDKAKEKETDRVVGREDEERDRRRDQDKWKSQDKTKERVKERDSAREVDKHRNDSRGRDKKVRKRDRESDSRRRSRSISKDRDRDRKRERSKDRYKR